MWLRTFCAAYRKSRVMVGESASRDSWLRKSYLFGWYPTHGSRFCSARHKSCVLQVRYHGWWQLMVSISRYHINISLTWWNVLYLFISCTAPAPCMRVFVWLAPICPPCYHLVPPVTTVSPLLLNIFVPKFPVLCIQEAVFHQSCIAKAEWMQCQLYYFSISIGYILTGILVYW